MCRRRRRRAASWLEHDLSEVLAALHHQHRLAHLAKRERLVDERHDLAAARELEARLDPGACEAEGADDAALHPEERDDVQRDDLAGVCTADDEAPILVERVEADLKQRAADVLVDEIDAAIV